jgi:phage terminase large subunit
VALPGTHHIETDYLGGFILSKIPQFASRVSYGDSARPETIGYLQRHEIPKMQACHKWPGCVEDGIAWLRSHSMIIIHPDCPELAEEFRLYSHKIVPRTREILQDIEDKNNHGIDALRYALGPAIRGHKYQQRSKLDFSSGSSLQWG